ncbi:MAG: D-alanyl-D-alanine dipeptidase [Cyanobacteria bacterium]|nr:D-alanyl-D-alanine dipeptidase [Cyanobacteriota bacterium]MDW8200783.1 M15 family metallopeptidase [Cyanobacteriota bacterium SKYGB_h_bin112]
MKPYQQIRILECGEPLVAIPTYQFAVETPHPYEKLGAPYGDRSPYHLRQGVLDRLVSAQARLQQRYPGWLIQIFDAYRPIAVQQFMVNYAFNQLLADRQLTLSSLSDAQQQALWEEVYQFWALPSHDPATPPPHSTGAAIDVTLVDATGQPVDMGGAIDEISPCSHPDYYTHSTDPQQQTYHHHRQLLHQIMAEAGFCRHPNEWWHFSYGDQLWAWQQQQQSQTLVTARYGAV